MSYIKPYSEKDTYFNILKSNGFLISFNDEALKKLIPYTSNQLEIISEIKYIDYFPLLKIVQQIDPEFLKMITTIGGLKYQLENFTLFAGLIYYLKFKNETEYELVKHAINIEEFIIVSK